ncbi:hypothetical protein BBK82_26545 [Lentzea guizhouensis]|uniref:Uncharacterized protein n=1 Tax=Lentzea guizhouensis TaxID=1586287 RepID=A0A1B2HN03_9PSEU|nr:hypothetical protein BBK82_26545 [Lentzea guizhouensis]
MPNVSQPGETAHSVFPLSRVLRHVQHIEQQDVGLNLCARRRNMAAYAGTTLRGNAQNTATPGTTQQLRGFDLH